MRQSLLFFIFTVCFSLYGCESSDEKAERIRLEQLYALDNLHVAQAYLKADTGGAAYSKDYLAIRSECTKEERSLKGRWCAKFSEIEKIYRGLSSDSLKKGLQRPNF